jgi:hypothetical protein
MPVAIHPSLCAPSAAQRSPGETAPGVVFTDDTFEDLYPFFLLRRIPEGPKATLWRRCTERWVRWSGRIVSFTDHGITLKQLNQTLTFDVSLIVDMPGRAQLQNRYRAGDQVTYLGRLDHYDDIFHTLYLIHGQVAKRDTVYDQKTSARDQ